MQCKTKVRLTIMESYKHCAVCENHIMDMKTGIKCGLTKQKPTFEFRCEKASFKDKLFKDIERIHLQIKFKNRNKTFNYFRFGLFIFFFLCFVLSGVLYLIKTEELKLTAFVLIGIGCSILTVGVLPFVNYSQDMADLRRRRKKLKKILTAYDISYQIDLKIKSYYKSMCQVESKITLFRYSQIIDTYKNSFDYLGSKNNAEHNDLASFGALWDTGDIQDFQM